MTTLSLVQEPPEWSRFSADDAVQLLAAAQELSRLRTLDGVMAVVRTTARALMNADGVTFVLREGQQVYYADEDAIGPLWKGRRFPASACVSGWAIDHRQSVAIYDVYADERVPVEAYRQTFVKSLLMVPIRKRDPIGAIGAYWATPHDADEREVLLLEALAGFAAVAVANAQLYQEARDAVRARDEWIGIASHELRTPLTPIKLQLQSVTRAVARGTPPADLAPNLDLAARNVERLARLVEQLLAYSRFTTSQVQLTLEPFDVVALAAEVCARFRESAAVELLAPPALRGRWDRRRVDEILTNLLSNAVRHGAGAPVTVELGRSEGSVGIVVSDRGGGIAPEHHERIFQPFTRLESAAPGVGLGLWIVRKNAQAHGGTVEVSSRPGDGASFIVTLPSVGAPVLGAAR